MTNEQIKKLESRLNEIERKINERLERMADDDLIEESARDLIDELDKIRKDFLKLITIPSKICEYVDPPEDNQRIVKLRILHKNESLSKIIIFELFKKFWSFSYSRPSHANII